MKRGLFVLIIFAAILIAGCKQKKEPVKVEVPKQVPVKVEKPKPVVEKAPEIDRGVHLSDKYFLVFNSYTVKEFAEERNKQFQKKGYKSAVVMRDDNGYYCLALESYNNYSMAKEAMIRLHEEPGLENVWIMDK